MPAAIDDSFIGRGVAFPPRVGESGHVGFSQGVENVRQSIRIVLLTEPGERAMLPEFGGGLRRFLFRPNTVATHRLIEEEISRALGRWEPRIRVERVDVIPSEDDAHVAVASIRFELVATREAGEVQVEVVLE